MTDVSSFWDLSTYRLSKELFFCAPCRLSVKFCFFAVVSWVLASKITRQPEIAYAKEQRFPNLSNKGKYKNILTNKMNNFSNGFRGCLIGTVAGVSDIRLKGRRFVSTLENQESCLVGTCGIIKIGWLAGIEVHMRSGPVRTIGWKDE